MSSSRLQEVPCHLTMRRCGVWKVLLACAFALVSTLAQGCSERETTVLAATPTRAPTATPSVEQVLGEQVFIITYEGRLIATERLSVERVQDQLIVTSQIQRMIDYRETERRSVVLSAGLRPLRYEIETSALGARSIWVGERVGDRMDCLSNNVEWLAPVLVSASPAPDVMLDSAPSALSYALLSLQYAEAGEDSLALGVVDLLEDYPVTRPLTVTYSAERMGAVIGTQALEGRLAGDSEPRFTIWVRSNSRVLYSVEVPAFRFSFWQQRAHPNLGRAGRLTIQRVSRVPDVPTTTPSAAAVLTTPVAFRGASGESLRGALSLPAGSGPFPCLVVHSRDGLAPRYDPASAVDVPGWAVFAYDKRGLGESSGAFDRGPLKDLAADALLAAQALASRPEIDSRRIVFLGLGDGGRAGAVALGMQAERGAAGYTGAVLGGAVISGQLFPTLVTYRARQAMAPFYAWDVPQLADYEKATVEQWRQWLFERQSEVTLLRRRASLRALDHLASVDLVAAIAASQVPVLLLHGDRDAWAPLTGAQEATRTLQSQGADVKLQVLAGVGEDLGGDASHPLGADAAQAMRQWLATTFR